MPRLGRETECWEAGGKPVAWPGATRRAGEISVCWGPEETPADGTDG